MQDGKTKGEPPRQGIWAEPTLAGVVQPIALCPSKKKNRLDQMGLRKQDVIEQNVEIKTVSGWMSGRHARKRVMEGRNLSNSIHLMVEPNKTLEKLVRNWKQMWSRQIKKRRQKLWQCHSKTFFVRKPFVTKDKIRTTNPEVCFHQQVLFRPRVSSGIRPLFGRWVCFVEFWGGGGVLARRKMELWVFQNVAFFY